mmetsp:Transcript_9174/g.22497  ORF Transcript_9174/g.22497 Transcript_9174/m.22497 type:complete len:240 (-) Transcript_9174:1-720(-)
MQPIGIGIATSQSKWRLMKMAPAPAQAIAMPRLESAAAKSGRAVAYSRRNRAAAKDRRCSFPCLQMKWRNANLSPHQLARRPRRLRHPSIRPSALFLCQLRQPLHHPSISWGSTQHQKQKKNHWTTQCCIMRRRSTGIRRQRALVVPRPLRRAVPELQLPRALSLIPRSEPSRGMGPTLPGAGAGKTTPTARARLRWRAEAAVRAAGSMIAVLSRTTCGRLGRETSCSCCGRLQKTCHV